MLFILVPGVSYATSSDAQMLNLAGSWFGITSIVVFAIAYATVISEEFLHLRKSKPVIVAAGVIWFLVGIAYAMHGDTHAVATPFGTISWNIPNS